MTVREFLIINEVLSQTNENMSKKLTAVEWLIEHLTRQPIKDITDEYWFGIMGQALEMERQQHSHTWDAAIQAHEDRGHNIARSWSDFDNYQIGQ